MNIDQPLTLLGGLTPHAFMRDYWQRKPLLIRQAIPGFKPSLSISDIRKLVRREEVESRLIWHDAKGWGMKTGPFSRLPSASRSNWTLLAQSVDLHDDATASLMQQFRFISDARLDDAMISIATDGGGVGPHFDSYDVFLLQAHGQRRWRISQQDDLTLEEGLPLKILKHFKAEEEFVLEPGDMLYLPPHAAHDGIAQGDCMTISIGFRAPTQATLASGMLEAANDQIMANLGDTGGLYALPVIRGPVLAQTYKDAGTPATTQPAALPQELIDATLKAINKIKFDAALAERFLGQWLTEPPGNAYFEEGDQDIDLSQGLPADGRLVLDRCTRLMYRKRQLFINGEVAHVPATTAMQRLADTREIECGTPFAKKLKPNELQALGEWLEEGWLHYTAD
ncbi:cupin domain-containing protein [Pollutimonas harenae]|uniref:Cupin domain-containing protein n=1 Tax=Pollutimonas harenae TaxID=657015 RepID=A0A853GTE7_9BURK|nr:cupin domain-containing protein [Pollutimonas harenae]NYT86428.1 cupin domain-containing protein [Pollutimonas harenae]TEA69820.1 cupin domain-containing protein [Pollutimonas harenae]